MWRSVDVVTAGAETTASSSVTRDSASAVSRSASSISLRGAVALEEDAPAAASRRSLDDDVDVVPVAGVGGHPPRGRVRVRQHAHVLEVGEVVADGRGGHAEVEALAEVLGPDRRAEAMYSSMTVRRTCSCRGRERQPTPLNAERETGARTPRRPRTAPFASRGLYHCAGKPIQRRRGCAATSRSTTAATSASGTRSPQRAASRRRSRARVAGVERLDVARRRPRRRRAPPPRRPGRRRSSSAGRRRCSRRPARGRGTGGRASTPRCGAPCAPAGRSC